MSVTWRCHHVNNDVIASIRRHLRGFRRIESALAGGTTDPESAAAFTE